VVASHHVPNIGNAIIPRTMGPIGTTLGWSRPSNTSAAKPFAWYLVVTANRTVNVLVLWGAQIKNIHNFHETWTTVPLWYKTNIKSGRKKQQILIQKTSEVLSLLRPIVHDTSKTAKITWFILVLHWATDVI